MKYFSENRTKFVRIVLPPIIFLLGVIIIVPSIFLVRILLTEIVLWQTSVSGGNIIQGILLNSFTLLGVVYLTVRRILKNLLSLFLRYFVGKDRSGPDLHPMLTLLVLCACLGYSFAVPEAFARAYEVLSQVGNCIEPINDMDFKFFSFTTFTTLGYGNVIPVGQCRGVAMAEAMMGMMVLPLLIAQALYTLGETFPRAKGQ